jgi:hypothetical protein
MTRLGVLGGPVRFAFRRMRERPLSVAVVALALAGAAALMGWSSLAAALSHEENVRLRFEELAPIDRTVQVVYSNLPRQEDASAISVDEVFSDLEAVVEPPRRLRIWHAQGATISGLRLAATDDPATTVLATSGRLPSGCRRRGCEALALAGDFRLGQRVLLTEGFVLRIVGLGSLHPEALPDPSELGTHVLFIPRRLGTRKPESPIGPLAPILRERGSTVVATAPLDNGAVRGSRLRPVEEGLREALARLERDPFIEAQAPLAILDELADRGEVARGRLLLVAGQGAALILAFALFAMAARRAETERAAHQLSTLGASRVQIVAARALEAAVPSFLGALVAIGALRGAAHLIARDRALPGDFVEAALPLETILVIVAVTTAALGLLVASVTPVRRSRFGLGPLEVGALAALGLIVWQGVATGGLDPDRIQAGADPGPVLLLLPALAFFTTGVLLLRVLPVFLRLAERVARAAPFAVRLGFMSAARSPAHVAAATTFLAVALGSALFALNYRETLGRQARDEAQFSAGAAWRLLERSEANRPGLPEREGVPRGVPSSGDVAPTTLAEELPAAAEGSNVTPLTRFARATDEAATPVLRFGGEVREGASAGEPLSVTVLALPARRVPDVLGWRGSFSAHSRNEIATLIRPRATRLTGLRIADDASAVRVWVRARTEHQRFAVLHFLLPRAQRFAHVRVGELGPRWRRLRVRVPPSLRGAELIGMEFPPIFLPFSAQPDTTGWVDVGRFEERRGVNWTPLAALTDWQATSIGGQLDEREWDAAPGRRAAPDRRGVRLELLGTHLALIRPRVPEGVPALVSGRVAAAAVDGRLTVVLAGTELPVYVAATARLFPTVTDQPSQFVVVDYESLFAALNVDQPGRAMPSEAWFFRPKSPTFVERLGEPPFRVETLIGAEPLTARLLNDPLAAGTRSVLAFAAVGAAVLALLGLILASRSALASERTLSAEYEALGVPPATLTRSAQLRLVVLSVLGVAAGLGGGLLAVRLVGALVSVTGTARRPLPPIEPAVAWGAGGLLLGAVAVIGVVTAALLASRQLRETAARRLRA